jgi:hypothetical protein
MVQQAPSIQQAYSAQEIESTSDGVMGAPLVLPFHAVYDQPPALGEGNIFITAEELWSMMSCLW